jgi:hypothetical protein
VVRFAEGDDDKIAIHRFLLVVAAPHLWGSIGVEKSLLEVIRVVDEEAALMAIVDDMLVGTVGIIKPVWWYGPDEFLTDRWNFCLPQYYHTPVEQALMNEVHALSEQTGLRFINQGKIRERKDGTGLMFPRIYTPSTYKEPPDVLRNGKDGSKDHHLDG